MKKLRILFVGTIIFGFIVLIGLYVVVTSEWFLKNQILPRAEKIAGVPITAEKVNLSPFKEISLESVTVGADPQPILKIGTLRARYQVFPLLKPKIVIDEFILDKTSLNLKKDKDGNLNLPQRTQKTAEESSSKKRSEKRPDFDIRNIRIKDLDILFTQEGEKDSLVAEIKGFNLDLKELKPDQPFAANLSSEGTLTKGTEVHCRIVPGTLMISGKLQRSFMPSELSVNGKVVLDGHAGGTDLQERTGTLLVNLNQTNAGYELSQCTIEYRNREAVEGKMSISGTFGLDPLMADMAIDFDLPTPNLLHILGSMVGDYNFGKTRGNYNGEAKIIDDGNSVSVKGKMHVLDFTVSSNSLGITALDPMNIKFEHDLAYFDKEQFIDLNTFDFRITSPQRELVKIALDQPAKIGLGATDNNQMASIKMVSKDLDLMVFKAFIPKNVPFVLHAGSLTNEMNFSIQERGQKIDFSGDMMLSGLDFQSNDSIRLSALDLHQTIAGDLDGLEKLRLTSFRTNLTCKNRAFLSSLITGKMDLDTLSGNFDLDQITFDPRVLKDLQIPFGDYKSSDFDFGDSQISYSGSIRVGENAEHVYSQGEFLLSIFTLEASKLGIKPLRPLEVKFIHNLDYGLNSTIINLENLAVFIDDAGRNILQLKSQGPGVLSLTNSVKKNSLTFSLKANAIDLVPLAPYVPEGVTLRSGTLSSDVIMNMDPIKITADLSGNIQVKDLEVVSSDSNDPLPAISKSITLDLAYNQEGMIVLEEVEITVSDPKSNILSLDISGSLYPSLDKPGSTLKITSADSIDAYRLEQMIPQTNSPGSEEVPAILQEAEPTSHEFSPMWLNAHIGFKEILYKDLVLQDVNGSAELENRTAKLEPFSFKINGGETQMTSKVMFPEGDQPISYQGNIVSSEIPFSPFFTTFVPKVGHMFNGHLKSLKIDFEGQGEDFDVIAQSMLANVNAELESLAIQKTGTLVDLLLDVLLFKRYGLGWGDLQFTKGFLVTGVKEGLIQLKNLTLSNEQLRISSAGTMEFGGQWQPDLSLTTGFRGRLAEKNNANLSNPDQDGYRTAASIAIPTWDYKKLAVDNVSGILKSTGVINSEDATKIDATLELGKEAGKALRNLFKRKKK